ncbi:hypothetical protein CAC01_21235 [Streptomyces sp. CLI2509]|nr:hypothetical protein CAC01_21235 [Streptomyces sp. CLI2509]
MHAVGDVEGGGGGAGGDEGGGSGAGWGAVSGGAGPGGAGWGGDCRDAGSFCRVAGTGRLGVRERAAGGRLGPRGAPGGGAGLVRLAHARTVRGTPGPATRGRVAPSGDAGDGRGRAGGTVRRGRPFLYGGGRASRTGGGGWARTGGVDRPVPSADRPSAPSPTGPLALRRPARNLPRGGVRSALPPGFRRR